MPSLIVKRQTLNTLLRFKDLKNLNNAINPAKLKLLKLNFKNAKYLISGKVSLIIAKFFAMLDTHLYLITNYNVRF